MRLTPPSFSTPKIALTLLALLCAVALFRPGLIQAQRNPPPTASVGSGSPLPVYMVNEPAPLVPEGFLPGTTWKFTKWTTPNMLSFTATVQKTEGGWAYLAVKTDTATASRWYYLPLMPGAWEQQQ
ncbi:MAG TPA: hypothetical protein VG273_28880 [Bryobacteraceae bacterium]|jgi:hypothetical protein|nr:hypothetical protein [Bryobacteraceae bacterium]